MKFDWENKEKAILTFRNTWEEFREALGKKEFEYTDLDKAKEYTFLKVLDDILTYEDNRAKLSVLFTNLYFHYSFIRATVINKDDDIQKLDFNRFLPNKECMKNDNRFSPKDKEFLYLACKTKYFKETNYKAIEDVALKEIWSENGMKIGICKFNVIKDYSIEGKRVIDLTMTDNKTMADIEKEFNDNIYEVFNGKYASGKVAKDFALKLYLNILSNEIFKPVNNAEKGYEYAPFHCLAYYFEKLGFSGIIYKSTVCDNKVGKNIVLFDKNYAVPLDFRVIDI